MTQLGRLARTGGRAAWSLPQCTNVLDLIKQSHTSLGTQAPAGRVGPCRLLSMAVEEMA